MTSDELYQDVLISRARKGKVKSRLDDPTGSATVDNPLCGDRVTVDVRITDGKIDAIGHEVRGCILCEATAAMIADYAPGDAISVMEDIDKAVRTMITDGAAPPPQWTDLAALGPVHANRSRHNCVLLPFDALKKALDASHDTPGF